MPSRVGYIGVWRKVQDNPLHFTQERRSPTRYEAREDLWFSAAWQNEELMSNGRPLTLLRGQVLTSILALSTRWRWSRHRVSDFLNMLESIGEITQNRDTKRTVITICNYDEYQNLRTEVGHQKDIKRTRRINLNKSEEEIIPPPPPLLPGRRFDGDAGVVESLIRECQNYALTAKAVHLVSLQAFQPMARLLGERDHDDIIDVFVHFVDTRERVLQITFQNFFRYYEDHERHTVKAMSEANYETFTERQRGKGQNGNGRT